MRWVQVLTLGLLLGLIAAVTSIVNTSPTEGATDTTHGVGLVDPATGKWYLYDEAGILSTSFFYGNPGDYPFMGDWDGDGIETPGLYRQSDGYVYLRNSNTQGIADIKFYFGNPGDVPIAGDFNGDGFDTVSIYRPSNQTFYIINELGENDGGLGAAEFFYVFGNPGDKPFVGDFDGDGIETVGLHRESSGLVYFRNSHTQGIADHQFIFGDPGDRLVAGDWNGNGTFTPALFRPSNTTTYFRYTNTQGNADRQWTNGESHWLPVAGRIEPGVPQVGLSVQIVPGGVSEFVALSGHAVPPDASLDIANLPPGVEFVAGPLESEPGVGVALFASIDVEPGRYAIGVSATACESESNCSALLYEPVTLTVSTPGPQLLDDVSAPAPQRWKPESGHLVVDDELIVTLAIDASYYAVAQDIAAASGGLIVGGSPDLKYFQLALPGRSSAFIAQIMADIGANPAVLGVELHNAPDGIVEGSVNLDEGTILARDEAAFALVGSDFPNDWADDGPDAKWTFEQTRVPETKWWQFGTHQVQPLVIADFGIYIPHSDLRDNIASYQHPFGTGRQAWADGDHGTHVAGIACAVGDNNRGLIGVSWECSLHALDLSPLPPSSATVVNAIDEYLDAIKTGYGSRPPIIVNMSFNYGPHSLRGCRPDSTYFDRIRFERLFEKHSDVMFIAAAGNCGINVDTSQPAANMPIPAALGDAFSNVLTVASTDSDRGLSSFSNYGRAVRTAAPGGTYLPEGSGVWSLGARCPSSTSVPCASEYRDYRGTSMAAPHIAGMISLAMDLGMYGIGEVPPAIVAECVIRSSVHPIKGSLPRGAGDLKIADARVLHECLSAQLTQRRSDLYKFGTPLNPPTILNVTPTPNSCRYDTETGVLLYCNVSTTFKVNGPAGSLTSVGANYMHQHATDISPGQVVTDPYEVQVPGYHCGWGQTTLREVGFSGHTIAASQPVKYCFRLYDDGSVTFYGEQ